MFVWFRFFLLTQLFSRGVFSFCILMYITHVHLPEAKRQRPHSDWLFVCKPRFNPYILLGKRYNEFGIVLDHRGVNFPVVRMNREEVTLLNS